MRKNFLFQSQPPTDNRSKVDPETQFEELKGQGNQHVQKVNFILLQ